ncbi:wax ester/triacylglycerol synthase family O-acyltransferase [Alteromonas sp. M12]|uniref:WS/DGAT/MGAT family O-acyltransferase n=1 Tax=Alteromonas sp. M12 TaxID=3135644 RepID=UPI00319DFB61
MRLIDAAWFLVEKPNAPAHFGPLIILSKPNNVEDTYVRDLVNEWRKYNHGYQPPFNYKLSMLPTPSWDILADSDIDLEYHLRHSALPAPGGEKELGELVSRLHSHPLDRDKPLWECHVIEGLENNRFALYLKLHHGQMDGMGTVKLIQNSFSLSPHDKQLPPWCFNVIKDLEKNPNLSELSEQVTFKPSLVNKLIKTASSTTQFSQRVLSFLYSAYVKKMPEVAAPFKAPDTLLNGRIHASRRYATQHYPLSTLKNIAKTVQVSINDVFLTICGGALRKYLSELNSLPDKDLIGQVPVNIRPKDGDAIGNSLAFIYSNLGTTISDPIERLLAIHKSIESGKSVQESLPEEGVELFSTMLLSPYMTEIILGLGGHVSPAANMVISNVRGPNRYLFFKDARVEHIYGPSVLFHGQALNITMSTYVNQVDIGFTGCRETLPSMQKLAVYTGEELVKLERAVNALDDQTKYKIDIERRIAVSRKESVAPNQKIDELNAKIDKLTEQITKLSK